MRKDRHAERKAARAGGKTDGRARFKTTDDRIINGKRPCRWDGWNDFERVRIARRFRHHVRTAKNPKGRIEREGCAFCPKLSKIEAHHVDYNQPFLIVWVCVSCHRKVEHGTLKVTKKRLRDYSKVVMQRPGAQLNTPF